MPLYCVSHLLRVSLFIRILTFCGLGLFKILGNIYFPVRLECQQRCTHDDDVVFPSAKDRTRISESTANFKKVSQELSYHDR